MRRAPDDDAAEVAEAVGRDQEAEGGGALAEARLGAVHGTGWETRRFGRDPEGTAAQTAPDPAAGDARLRAVRVQYDRFRPDGTAE